MFIRAFDPNDLKLLALQDEQSGMQAFIDNPEYGVALAAAGECFTAEENGRILGCAGVNEFHKGRAELWALFSPGIGPHMRTVTRAALGWISQSKYPRLEANVATEFSQGHQWAKLLGFLREGPDKEKYFPDGRSSTPYVRLK